MSLPVLSAWLHMDHTILHTGCHSRFCQLGYMDHTIRAVTPGCQIGYMDHTVLAAISVLTAG
jgi:hypothetical protein